ncbi:MAG TPA: hypothetical protein DEP87_00100 [Candidatus Pacebacteria bacterium]|nr:hypothetical protein [Candidatus Paceibacterota bacterium]
MSTSKTPAITAVIIARNEAQMLPNCLQTLKWCQEVLVIDNGSTDKTAIQAEKFGAEIITINYDSFAKLRNEALKRVKTPWLIYIDADERVSPALAREILVTIETQKTESQLAALAFNRTNIFYGHPMLAGGWQEDVVPRVFKTTALKFWTGMVHETPHFEGDQLLLQQPLIHLTHRSTADGLLKTATWTHREAQLLYESNLPPVTLLTLLRKTLAEIWRRAIVKKGYRDGQVGWIEALIQGMNKMLIYIQVWELQQKPSLNQQYDQFDKQLITDWQNYPDLL